MRGIELRARRLVSSQFLGEYRAVFRGRGVEFDELRPYVPGDDVRSIDWRTLARTGEAFVRRYTEDRDLTVIFAVDVSGSQNAGALASSKADLAAEVCAVLALAATRSRDRVGLLLFASEPERYIRPQGGVRHVLRVVREVLGSEPETAGTNIASALEYLSGVQRRRAIVFLISDFLSSGFDRQLRALARRHDVIAVRVREEIDARLPDAGLVVLRDPESGEEREIDSSSPAVRRAYSDWLNRLDEERGRLFGSLDIDEISLAVGEDYIPPLLR
ncbi:MAG: DUF58 domain-containing protein, partial [Dehalococcoidia bacterium]